MKLIIASNNADKVVEMKTILGRYFDEILSLRDAGIEVDVVENGAKFMENALKKAIAVLEISDADAVVSDDSGLMVDALDGAPGIYSARYAGEGHNDQKNNEKLLEEMKDIPYEQRDCKFVSAVVIARRNEAPVTAIGTVEGRILFELRGENGFGYDPLFLYEPLNRTFAELSAQEKNEVSHRRRALDALCAKLDEE